MDTHTTAYLKKKKKRVPGLLLSSASLRHNYVGSGPYMAVSVISRLSSSPLNF